MLTADEECVAGENSTVIAVFEQEADAVLSVAWCVQGFHFDVLADGEGFAVAWGGGDLVAVLATDDRKGVALEELDVTTGVVVVAECLLTQASENWWQEYLLVGVDDVCQFDAAFRCFLQVR
jgi:hypothetical protein